MAGLKFSSFGAATMPLSKIVVDGDLDLRPYDIIAENALTNLIVDADLDLTPYGLKIQTLNVTEGIGAVCNPNLWPTESLAWSADVAPSILFTSTYSLSPTGLEFNFGAFTHQREVTVKFTHSGTGTLIPFIKIGTTIVETGPTVAPGNSWTSAPFWLPEDGLVILGSESSTTGTKLEISATGRIGGNITVDMGGKWLTLDIDMKGLNPTFPLLTHDIPYTDYIRYFPLRPTELTFPGGWAPHQIRPDLKVYKGW